MSIQNSIDAFVDGAVERFDFDKALRMRWMSHANHNATIEPDEIITWLWNVKVSEEAMDKKVFVRRLWIDDWYESEKIRDMLNNLGFYVLRMRGGLEVNAIKSTPDGLVEWFKELVGKE